jgi:hypothetical protein
LAYRPNPVRRVDVSPSPTLRNKPRHPGLYHGIELDPRRDAIPDLEHRVFRQREDLKVLLDVAGRDRGGQEGCATLYSPGEHDLGGRFANALRDTGDHRIFQ